MTQELIAFMTFLPSCRISFLKRRLSFTVRDVVLDC